MKNKALNAGSSQKVMKKLTFPKQEMVLIRFLKHYYNKFFFILVKVQKDKMLITFEWIHFPHHNSLLQLLLALRDNLPTRHILGDGQYNENCLFYRHFYTTQSEFSGELVMKWSPLHVGTIENTKLKEMMRVQVHFLFRVYIIPFNSN